MQVWHLFNQLVINWVLDRVLIHQLRVQLFENADLRFHDDLFFKLLLFSCGKSDLAINHSIFQVTWLG
jgi:hypothetical protein